MRRLDRLVCSSIIAVAMTIAGAGLWSSDTVRAESGGAIPTRELLQSIIPDTELNEVPLRDAIDYVRNATGANIFVNWGALEAAGVSNLTPITLNLQNITVDKLLTLIMAQASSSVPTVDYVDENVLMITTRADADTHLVTRIYDVSDLIMTVPNFTNAPTLNLAQASQSQGASISSTGTGGGGGGGGSGGSIFGSSGGGSASQTTQETPDQMGQDLCKLVESTIYPSVWIDNGGQASIVYFNRSLVVTAPEYIQELIGG